MSFTMFGQMFNVRNCKLLRKKIKIHSLFSRQWKNIKCNIPCAHLSSQKNVINNEECTRLCNVVNFRHSEAKKSILVQVQSAQSYKELYAYCQGIGDVQHMFHYSSGVEPLHFILIEFATENDVNNVLSSSCHIDDIQAVPVKSRFLWFRLSPSNKKVTLKTFKRTTLDVENGNKLLSNNALAEHLRTSENISEQMSNLYELTKLNDLGIRLRFLTALQVESAVSGMFPHAAVYPFGSSINGYGKMGCDLDLILKLNSTTKDNDESRLVYQCKAGMGNERSQSQRHMETIGDLLQLFLPGCSQVRRILQARVPILKYNHHYTDIECDLSMTNMTAFSMSELLYLYGEIDERVRPLVFTIRKWAQQTGLTNNSPGRWITNFSLTLLVLAFLQRLKILPSVNTLTKIKTTALENEVCAFPVNVTRLPKITNTDSLQVLLMKFFEFYSGFDFSAKALSLNEATAITKPEHSALYIVNPLEKVLNVSKNVSPEELEHLRIEIRNAAWLLESEDKKIGQWGILSLFNESRSNNKNFVSSSSNKQGNRLIDVDKLFEQEELLENEEIVFNNDETKKQVENIKKETEMKIREIASNSKLKLRRHLKRNR